MRDFEPDVRQARKVRISHDILKGCIKSCTMCHVTWVVLCKSCDLYRV